MEHGYDADDKCGRCGCSRRDHMPACTGHPKCKGFSEIRKQRVKKK